jgi:hypothetical protein
LAVLSIEFLFKINLQDEMTRLDVKFFNLGLLLLILTHSIFAGIEIRQHPCREAHLLRKESNGTVLIQATGFQATLKAAQIDAEKTAILWLIRNHLLRNIPAVEKFEMIRSDFFEMKQADIINYSDFIEYRSDIESQRKLDNGYQITMSFIINLRKLGLHLKRLKIIEFTPEEIFRLLGRPTFLVTPARMELKKPEQVAALTKKSRSCKQSPARSRRFCSMRIAMFIYRRIG